MNKKSIVTEYKGYKFRSRLEARWAVFFDEMKVKYLFEPEGFYIGRGKYLPDFHLPEGMRFYNQEKPHKNLWVEVKPSLDMEYHEKQKITQFVKETKNHVLLLAGDPGLETEILYLSLGQDQKVGATKISLVELEDGLGLLDLEKFNTNTNPGVRHAIKQLCETAHVMSSYKKSLQYPFEKADSYQVDQLSKRVCEDCGREFIPQYDSFVICKSCYYKRMYEPKDQNADEKNQQRSFFSKKGFLIGAGIFLIIAVIAIVYQVSRVNNEGQGLFGSNSKEICVCTSNQYNCSDFVDSEEAQTCFDFCYPNYGDVHFLDIDEDLIACEPNR